MKYDSILDVRNEDSPIPVIRTSERLNILPVGSILKVVVNKDSAIKNIRTLISNNPYVLLNDTKDSDALTLYIQKCDTHILS